MPFSDLKMRFVREYKGDIKDPVLTTLLQTIDGYQTDLQDRLFLSIYSQRSDQISDGLFEVLRRHLFGQMFPGPAYAVAHATIRGADTAAPLKLEQHHYITLQDAQGDQVLFAPQEPVWIVPSFTNDVQVQVVGEDLMLGLTIPPENLREAPEAVARVYASGVEPLLLERLRCRLPSSREKKSSPPPSVLRPGYPGSFTFVDDFFHTPYASSFLELPLGLLQSAARRDEALWLPFPGMGEHARELERKLTLNAFVVWNMVFGEMLAIPADGMQFRMPISSHGNQETIPVAVLDLGTDPSREYVNAAAAADPGYPFQYTTSVDPARDDIFLTLSPAPAGEVKVEYYQYDIGDRSLGVGEGRSFGLYKGIDERIKTVQTLTPTHRLEALSDKQRIWEYFRSLLASRNRWLTRDDLRAAVCGFPQFGGRRNLVVRERIGFTEQVGRMGEGFLTPFTEILVPLRENTLLREPDQAHFERLLEEYIMGRTVNGNFVRVKLVSVDEL